MSWKYHVRPALDKILDILDEKDLFHDRKHRQLFHEITNCYVDSYFFTPGMVKCMYMASWDDEHFAQLLSMLTMMTFNSSTGMQDMAENGQLMAEEAIDDPSDQCILQLSCAFIENTPFNPGIPTEQLNEHAQAVITWSLKAAAQIDRIASEFEEA